MTPHHDNVFAPLSVHTVGGYREYAPPPELAPLVAVAWTHFAAFGAARAPHRVLPEPDVSLCYFHRRGSAGDGEPEGLFLIGPVRTPRFHDPAPGNRMHAIQLKPEWCRALLGTHPTDHVDAVDDLEGVLPELARPLLDRLAGLRTTPEILAAMADAVRRRAARAELVPGADLAHQGLERLRQAAPGVRIGAVCQDWGISSRHLRRTVVDATGTSPKRLLRAKRLAAVLFRADGQARPQWSRLALDFGYADQSHFIRECHALAAAPPGTLHAERRAQPIPAH